MALIGDYNVGQKSTDWEANFQMPVNCEYTVTNSGTTNYINIALKKGETNPSPTLGWENVTFPNTTNLLDLQFTQTDKNGTVTKPKIIITAN